MTTAEERARTLLRTYLTPEQSAAFDTGKGFIEVAPSGRQYLLGKDFYSSIIELNTEHGCDVKHCLVFDKQGDDLIFHSPRRPTDAYDRIIGNIPPTDLIITAVLMIRYHENALRTTAEPSLLKYNTAYESLSSVEREAWDACEGICEVAPHVLHPEAGELQWFIGLHTRLDTREMVSAAAQKIAEEFDLDSIVGPLTTLLEREVELV